MIGDGNNDAPVLAESNLGTSFGVPTSLATDAADEVIPGNRLDRIFSAFALIKTTRRRIRQKLAGLYCITILPFH